MTHATVSRFVRSSTGMFIGTHTNKNCRVCTQNTACIEKPKELRKRLLKFGQAIHFA